MKETEIRKYAELMKELGLTGLEVSNGNGTLRLERAGQVAFAPSPSSVTRTDEPELSAPSAPDYISIKSPIVGVFYAAPAENAAPFVTIGDNVKKGQTLCVIEAMKLMNEIPAEENGVILEVCVTNGQIVEYGTELFRIRKGD